MHILKAQDKTVCNTCFSPAKNSKPVDLKTLDLWILDGIWTEDLEDLGHFCLVLGHFGLF